MYQVVVKVNHSLTLRIQFHIFSFSVTRTNKEYKDELTARQMANDNPFDSYILKPEPGRGLFKNHPVLVPSMKTSRWRFNLNAFKRPWKYKFLGWLAVVARMITKTLSGSSSTKVKHNSATAEITLNLLTMIHLTRISNPNTEWVLVLVSVQFIIEVP